MSNRYPPKTIRFCLACKECTTFKYEPCVGHSRCIDCGGFMSAMPDFLYKCKICGKEFGGMKDGTPKARYKQHMKDTHRKVVKV